MVTRRTFLGGLVGAAIAPAVLRAQQAAEPEFLKERLTSGSLPPMAERIPLRPRIVNLKEMGLEPGAYGGTVRTIIGSQRDIRFMTIYGYAAWSATTSTCNFSRIFWPVSSPKTTRSSPSRCARAINGPTASRSRPTISATGGKTSS